jgi:hypothetical protein
MELNAFVFVIFCSISTIPRECMVDIWDSILCPVDDSPWHNPSCLNGTCAQCGIDMLTYLVEEDAIYSQFQCSGSVVNYCYMARLSLERTIRSCGYNTKILNQSNSYNT